MNRFLYLLIVLVVAVAVFAFAFVYSGRPRRNDSGAVELVNGKDKRNAGRTADAAPAKQDSGAANSGTEKPAKTRAERDKEKFILGEMRNDAEDLLRRFRGTPEERQEVIDECEGARELIRTITPMLSYESMKPEDLVEAREDFEKEYRVILDYLRSGKLHRMLKTPEEQEILGGAFDAVQEFLETIDKGLIDAGY